MAETFTNDLPLSMWAQGDNPTAAKLNANWTKIDQNLLGKGTAFPSTFYAGKLFLRTDQACIYQNTGTTSSPVWTPVLDLGSEVTSIEADIATEAAARVAGDAATLTAAEAYANTGDSSTLSAAEAYADAGDVAEAASRTAADNAEALARTNGDAATLTAAESYADTGDAAEAAARAAADTAEASARVAADALLVPKTTTLTGTDPIQIDGGASGDLSANRTISIKDASTSQKGAVQLAASGEASASKAVTGADSRLAAASVYASQMFY